MYKKQLLKLLDKVETWEEIKRLLSENKIKYRNRTKEFQKIFETFAKYYFLSESALKSIYKNSWLYEEIPNELKKKFGLKPVKDFVSLLLENKKGKFTLVRCVYKKDEFSPTDYKKDDIEYLFSNVQGIDEFIVLSNTERFENFPVSEIKIINESDLKRLSKFEITSLCSQLKSDPESSEKSLRKSIAIFRYSLRALELVWSTSPKLTIFLAFLTLVTGLLPAAVAYTGKLIIDSVIFASKTGTDSAQLTALIYLGIEACIIILLEAGRRGLGISQSLLRALLGQKVNVLILEKALKLDLSHFENSEFYDKMTRARREASSRPLSLVNKTFNLIQSILSLIAYGGLLITFSFWSVIALILTSIPSFIAETKFATQAFRLFSWRAPEAREQMYLETLIAREDYAKEVKLFQLGKMMLERYKSIFERIYSEDRELTLNRGIWGFFLSLLSTVAFYGAYAWILFETIKGKITLGEMTMYITIFRQGQSTLSASLSSVSGMYEDNLYLSNLYEFLEFKVSPVEGNQKSGLNTIEGIQFENVTFTYPGSTKEALKNINLRIIPGEKLAIVGGNGSGKTTLIKLLTRLYNPDSGKIYLDGIDLREWDIDILHKRIGVIFQNFVHYQFSVGENIGVGDVQNLDDELRLLHASEKGMAFPFIKGMPAGFKTQLGSWFKGGQELSLGQWQKIALSRAFMRHKADILVLDEPTSAMDAEAEAMIFEHFRTLTKEQMVILISHRFSTVRMADKIAVIENGSILEFGSHQELLTSNGKYAHLFSIQAAGYK